MYRWRWPSYEAEQEMARMRRDFDRVFGRGGLARPQTVYPAINIYDDGESFIARAELPGVSADDLDVTVTGNTLTLKGERKPFEVPQTASYHRRECDCGQFNRSFRLPEPVDSTKVSASFQNGVLELLLPRAESARARKVEIN
jgi:HSP20 family protein